MTLRRFGAVCLGFGSLLVLLREEFVSLTGAVAVCDLTNLLVREERRVALDCGGSSHCCLVSGGRGSLLLLFSFGFGTAVLLAAASSLFAF